MNTIIRRLQRLEDRYIPRPDPDPGAVVAIINARGRVTAAAAGIPFTPWVPDRELEGQNLTVFQILDRRRARRPAEEKAAAAPANDVDERGTRRP